MGHWNSGGMKQCLHSLQESEKNILKIAEECAALAHSGDIQVQNRPAVEDLELMLRNTADLAAAVIECIVKVDKLYLDNEQKIADYFDLAFMKAPHTEVGISTLNSLSGHEDQMPFERRE